MTYQERTRPDAAQSGGILDTEAVDLICPGSVRLDAWLAGALDEVSRAEIQRWIKEGAVLVDGIRVRPGIKPDRGALVRVVRPPASPSPLRPEAIPLKVVYEDADLIVIDKPAGLTVHPGAGVKTGTLVHALLALTGPLSEVGGAQRPGIVHRLDKDTSGLLVVARNDFAHRRLAQQIASKVAGRQYLAIVWGNPEWNHATVKAPIGRDPQHRTRMAVLPENEGGRDSETLLDVEERLGMGAVLRARLTTGRTHQIRVHCAYSNIPVVCDPVYGLHKSRCQAVKDPAVRERLIAIQRQALHACYLSFTHPRTGESLEFRSDPPAGWTEILELMRRAGR